MPEPLGRAVRARLRLKLAADQILRSPHDVAHHRGHTPRAQHEVPTGFVEARNCRGASANPSTQPPVRMRGSKSRRTPPPCQARFDRSRFSAGPFKMIRIHSPSSSKLGNDDKRQLRIIYDFRTPVRPPVDRMRTEPKPKSKSNELRELGRQSPLVILPQRQGEAERCRYGFERGSSRLVRTRAPRAWIGRRV
jgi:hypothetical protein